MKPPRRFRRLAAFAGPGLLTLVLTELALRMVFVLPGFGALAGRLAGTIGDGSIDDNKQRLLLRVESKQRESLKVPARFHPTLGLTATARTASNPFGILTDVPYLRDERKKMLFFGDSFVEGYTEAPYKIPQILDRELEDYLVLNFGVRGYGLDQMYLYLRWAIEELEPKHVLIGVLYADINRLLFQLSQGPKPYFEAKGGRLVLRGVPIPSDPEVWLEIYPPRMRSYLFSAGRGLVRRLLVSRWATQHFYSYHPSQTTRKREQIKLLTRGVVEKIREVCQERGAGLTFILFPHVHHLIHEGWEELFMRELLLELGIDHVDMQVPLKAHVEANELVWWRDVYPLSAHPDRRENQIMADYLHGHLCREIELASCDAQ